MEFKLKLSNLLLISSSNEDITRFIPFKNSRKITEFQSNKTEKLTKIANNHLKLIKKYWDTTKSYLVQPSKVITKTSNFVLLKNDKNCKKGALPTQLLSGLQYPQAFIIYYLLIYLFIAGTEPLPLMLL